MERWASWMNDLQRSAPDQMHLAVFARGGEIRDAAQGAGVEHVCPDGKVIQQCFKTIRARFRQFDTPNQVFDILCD
jgi:hypothetical protein